MTVSSEIAKSGPYTGNGVTTVFAYGFRILDPSHIRVIRSASGTTSVVDPNDYTVSGAGGGAFGLLTGGNVTFDVAPAAGETITIIRDVPFTQQIDLENQGAYYAETIEEALDLAVMRDQQMQEEIDRSLKIAAGAAPEDADALVDAVVEVAENISAVQSVAADIGNVNAVAGNAANVNLVAGEIASVIATGASIGDVQAVAAGMSDVVALLGNMDDVSAVAENLADVTWISDVYYGPSSTDPTTRRDGSPLQAGDFYYNTVADMIRVRDGEDWVSSVRAGEVSKYFFVATEGQTAFTGLDANGELLSVTPGSLLVHLNGLALTEDVDYEAKPSSITLSIGASASDELTVLSIDQVDFTDTILQMSDLRDQAAASALAASAFDGNGLWADTTASLLEGTGFTYAPGNPGSVIEGQYIKTRDTGLAYQVAAAGAADYHAITAGGVRLYAAMDAEGAWHFAQFGGLPSTPQDPRMCDDAMDRLVAAIPAGKPGAVKFAKGYYFFERGHVLPRDVKYVGTGAIPMRRFGTASATHYEANVRSLNCTNFIFCGTGPKVQSIRFATKGRQCGYDHAVTATGRIYNNAADATFELDDFTNQNATKANPPQPATPRLFSACISFVENFGRIHIENIRVTPSCPGAGEVQGVGGYLVADAVMPYADWDVGLFLTNPWGATVKYCDVVGYYRIKGILSFGTFKEPILSGFTPNAEHGSFEEVQLQCGFGFRDVDSWPIIDKTSANIYVRWTASHQFSPTGGQVRIGTTDSVAGDIIYEYGSTSYTASATTPNGATDALGDGWLILRDVRPLGAGANDTSAIATMITNPGACSKVRQGFSGGPSHTFFDRCIFTDFAHATGMDEAAPDFTGLRDRYSTAMEISGVPARALKFLNCTFTTSGPRVIHVGAARDLTMIGDNYAEVRPYRTVLGGPLDGNRGGVFLAGPSLALRSETGLVGAAQLRNYGNFLNDIIGMHPYAAARAGTRMQDQADYFWAALGVVDLSNTLPANTSDQLQIFGGNDQQVRIGRRSLTGALVDYLLFRTASGVDRIDMMKGQINILDGTGVRPSSNDTLTLGQTSFRWSNLFARVLNFGSSGNQTITTGIGSPEGVVTAGRGSIYTRQDGGSTTTLYIKTSGAGNTGWVAK